MKPRTLCGVVVFKPILVIRPRPKSRLIKNYKIRPERIPKILSNSSLCLYSLSLVFRLGVDFFLPLSQEEQEEQEQEQEEQEEPLTKIYQKGKC